MCSTAIFSESPPTSTPEIIDVSISNFFFDPSAITIKVGDTVRWTHNGSVAHTTTSDNGPGAIWDSNDQTGPSGMRPGDVFEFTFTEEGNFAFFCRFHGASGGIGMSGTINVMP